MNPLAQISRFLLTVPLIAVSTTLLHAQRPIYASELIQDFFLDDARMQQHMQKSSGQEDALITKKDIDEFRKGICLAWDNYRRYPPNQGIKELCVKLISGNAPSRINALPTKQKPLQEDSHSACLNAKDYEGCMRYQAGRSETKADNCKPGKWCKATAGIDILGKPKIEGWWMKSTPESQSVGYLRPKPRKVLVRGKTDRYIAREMVIRYYQAPRAGTAPTTTTIGSSTTNCYDAGYSFNCTTTPATTITSPGVAARPGGVVQFTVTTVIDCHEKTVGNHRGNQLDGKWVKLSKTSHQKLANNFCPVVESLELSSFSKYAE
ncbi:hypothetical protein [Synechococcus sp. N19]|uniref:hypothetical protein n=1 Tax=Synechococcus sp. N19 TaxID=2575512 RepID=UPI0010BE8142|nr:hypothetical protein [Synechococcus sp. N19]